MLKKHHLAYFFIPFMAFCSIIMALGLMNGSYADEASKYPAFLNDVSRSGTFVTNLKSKKITEMSGLIGSLQYKGLYWTLNDSGNAAELFRVDSEGNDLGRVKIKGATNIDWEALTIGPCNFAKNCIYIGDIGDNFYERRQVRIYVIAEPDKNAKEAEVLQTIKFKYPQGAHNAEAMVFDPYSKDLLIIQKNSKSDYGSDISVVRVKPDLSNEKNIGANVFEFAKIRANFNIGKKVGTITDAVLSHDGQKLYLRDYDFVYEADFNEFYKGIPVILKPLQSPKMAQGESLAISSDDKYLLTGSEGVHGGFATFPIAPYSNSF